MRAIIEALQFLSVGLILVTAYIAIDLRLSFIIRKLKKLEKQMSVVTDSTASVETALAKVSADIQTLATNAASQAAAITALQAQLATAGLTQADTDALVKVVADANALAAAADAAVPVAPPA